MSNASKAGRPQTIEYKRAPAMVGLSIQQRDLFQAADTVGAQMKRIGATDDDVGRVARRETPELSL